MKVLDRIANSIEKFLINQCEMFAKEQKERKIAYQQEIEKIKKLDWKDSCDQLEVFCTYKFKGHRYYGVNIPHGYADKATVIHDPECPRCCKRIHDIEEILMTIAGVPHQEKEKEKEGGTGEVSGQV